MDNPFHPFYRLTSDHVMGSIPTLFALTAMLMLLCESMPRLYSSSSPRKELGRASVIRAETNSPIKL